MRRIAAENVVNFLRSGRLRSCVNANLLPELTSSGNAAPPSDFVTNYGTGQAKVKGLE
jgi:hypothetical protein